MAELRNEMNQRSFLEISMGIDLPCNGSLPVSYFRTIWAIYLHQTLLYTGGRTKLGRFVLTIRRFEVSFEFVILAE